MYIKKGANQNVVLAYRDNEILPRMLATSKI